MKYFLTAILLSAMPIAHAQAQNVVMMNNGGGSSLAMRPAIGDRGQTLTINFQLSEPVPPMTSSSDLTKTMAAASQSLYDIVNRECDVLSASLKGDCRLVQINIGGNLNTRLNQANPVVTANAAATFAIEPKAAPTTVTPQQ